MVTSNIPKSEIIQETSQAWNSQLVPAGCPSCHKVFLVNPARKQLCPGCAIGQLISQPISLRPEPPERLIPFQIKLPELRNLFTEFTKGIWLAPDDFTPSSLVERSVPVFLPFWMVDSDVNGHWKAEVGFNYEVKSSQEYYYNGQWRNREIIETRIRWEPRLGRLMRHYDNVTVPALSNIEHLEDLIGGYKDQEAIPYSANELSTVAVQVPDLEPESVWPLAQSSLNAAAAMDCQKAASGQHIRNFSLDARYDRLNWSQLLVPLYVTHYHDDSGKPNLVYIHGQTGKISGPRLTSQRKGWMFAGSMAAIAIVLVILGLLASAAGAALPPLLPLGMIGIIFGLILIILAIITAAWPWQWNRRQLMVKITHSGQE